MSGVIVATMIRSICSGETPPLAMARNAALAAMWEVCSLAAAMRRCLMPVRVVNGPGAAANGVFDGEGARRTVGLDHRAIQAQQRRAAIVVRVHPALDRTQPAISQSCAEFAKRITGQLRLQHNADCFAHALA